MVHIGKWPRPTHIHHSCTHSHTLICTHTQCIFTYILSHTFLHIYMLTYICFHTQSITHILTPTCLQISCTLTHVSSPKFSHTHAHKYLIPSHTFAIHSHRFHTDMLTHSHSLTLKHKTLEESAFNEAFAGGGAGSGRVRKNPTDCHGACSALGLGR